MTSEKRKPINQKGLAIAVASAIIAGFPALESFAQSSTTQTAAHSIDEIVVTARRREESLQSVPVAVTAITGERLDNLGVTDVMSLRQVVPGLTVNSYAGQPASVVYSVRGQVARDIVITQDLPVAVYVDEVLVTPAAGSNLGLFDLENAQVLKGPQGTLFGRNTTGGAILYTTAKPTEEFGGSLRVGYGNYDERRFTGVLNMPVSEAVRLRGAVHYVNNNGFGKVRAGPAAGDGTGSRQEKSVRFTAAIDPTDWLSTMTTYYYTDADFGAATFLIPDTPRPGGNADFVFNSGVVPGIPENSLRDAIARISDRDYDIESAFDVGNTSRVQGIYNASTIELSDNLSFKNIFSYRKSEFRGIGDMDGTILPILDIHNVTFSESWTEEAQFQGTAFDNRLEYIAGVYYYQLQGRDGGEGTVNFGGPPGIQQGIVENKSFSGFGQISYDLTDTLTLNAGLRYTVDERKIRVISGTGRDRNALTSCNFTDPEGNPLPLDACHVENDKSFNNPSWLIGLDKKLGPDTLLYIVSRHSYRSGGFNMRGNSNDLVTDTFFDPELVTDVEVGLKTGFELGHGWTMTANTALYHQWYEDIQRNISTFRGGAIGNVTQNAAKAKIYGGEVEINLRSASLVNLSLSYAHVHEKYDDYPTYAPVFGVPNQPDDYSNRNFSLIPRHQIVGNITLTPDVGEWGFLSLTANVYYQSDTAASEDYQTRAQLARRISPEMAPLLPDDLVYRFESQTLVNLRVGLDNILGSNFSAALWSNNVFDKRYIDSGTPYQDSVGMTSVSFIPPRTYGLDLTYVF